MTRTSMKLVYLGLAAVLAVAADPVTGLAGALGFRNDTSGPVIVQGMSIIRGQIRAGKRHVLQPGDVGWDQIVAPGSKLIVISDAKQPTRTLYQNTIQFLGNTQFYSIKAVEDPAAKDTQKKKGLPKAQKPPKIEIQATTPPPMGTTPSPRR
jgi:hypothetical protein